MKCPLLVPLFLTLFLTVNGQDPDFKFIHKQFLNELHSSEPSTEKRYLPHALAIIDGAFHHKSGTISSEIKRFAERNSGLKKYRTKEVVRHNKDHFYEAGLLKAKSGKKYVYIIAWKWGEGRWNKELEIIQSKNRFSKSTTDGIDEARKKWVDLSNAHDPETLIREVYSSEPSYFNGGTLYVGENSIIDKYQYMKRDNWTISLTPIYIVQPQTDLFYEIGRYKSSGVGHYVLIWERQDSGTWQASFDFNF